MAWSNLQQALERLDRFDVTTQVLQQVGAVVEGRDQARIDRQRIGVTGQRLLVPPEAAQDIAAVVVGVRMLRLRTQGRVVAVERFLQAPQMYQDIAAVVQCTDMIGLQAQGGFVALQSFGEAPEILQRMPADAHRADVSGLQRQCAFAALQRLCRPLEGALGQCTVRQSQHEIRPRSDCVVVAVERLLLASQVQQSVAVIVPGLGEGGARLQCLAVKGQGVSGAVEVAQHDPAAVQAVGIVRAQADGGEVGSSPRSACPRLLHAEASPGARCSAVS